MESTPAIEMIHTDGTAEYKLQKYRFSATSNRGNPEGLLKELENKTTPLPWISHVSRDTALETIKRLPLDNNVKTSLVHHTCNTGYLENTTEKRIKVFFAEESRGFTGEGIACWGLFEGGAPWLMSHLVTDYLDALQAQNRFQLALPFESKEIWDRALEAIADCPEGDDSRGWGELPAISQKMRENLIKAGASAGYVT